MGSDGACDEVCRLLLNGEAVTLTPPCELSASKMSWFGDVVGVRHCEQMWGALHAYYGSEMKVIAKGSRIDLFHQTKNEIRKDCGYMPMSPLALALVPLLQKAGMTPKDKRATPHEFFEALEKNLYEMHKSRNSSSSASTYKTIDDGMAKLAIGELYESPEAQQILYPSAINAYANLCRASSASILAAYHWNTISRMMPQGLP